MGHIPSEDPEDKAKARIGVQRKQDLTRGVEFRHVLVSSAHVQYGSV